MYRLNIFVEATDARKVLEELAVLSRGLDRGHLSMLELYETSDDPRLRASCLTLEHYVEEKGWVEIEGARPEHTFSDNEKQQHRQAFRKAYADIVRAERDEPYEVD